MALVPQNELDYNEIMKDIQELKHSEDAKKPFGMTAKYKITIFDKDGKVVKVIEDKMRSLTFGFLYIIELYIVGTNNYSSLSYSGINGINTGSYLINDYSIIVGSGTQTFSPSVNSLAAQITSFSTSSYASVSYSTPNNDSFQMVISQTFSNPTSTTITVSEFGLLLPLYNWNGVWGTNSVIKEFNNLGSYETPTPFSVPPGAVFQIQITITIQG